MPWTWHIEGEPSEEHTAGNLHVDVSGTTAWNAGDHLFVWSAESWKALKVEPAHSAEVKNLSVIGTWTEQFWEQGLREKTVQSPV